MVRPFWSEYTYSRGSCRRIIRGDSRRNRVTDGSGHIVGNGNRIIGIDIDGLGYWCRNNTPNQRQREGSQTLHYGEWIDVRADSFLVKRSTRIIPERERLTETVKDDQSNACRYRVKTERWKVVRILKETNLLSALRKAPNNPNQY
jgi:hypothetical protein